MNRLTHPVLVVLALAGCSSASEPAGDPEPHPVPASAVITERTVIFSDTVTMRDGQRWHLELTARSAELELSADGSYVQAVTYFARFHGTLGFGGTWTDSGAWSRRGDSLFFDSGVVDSLEYAGALTEMGLDIRQDILGLGGVGVYRYIG